MSGPPVAELRSFSCRFPGGRLALAGVDLAVRAGEIVAVMGHTGAGKSTLLKCLSGVVPAYEAAELEGERRLFGRPADDLAPADLAGRVGVVFQDFEAQLFSTNVALEVGFALDQLGLERGEIRARSAQALVRVGLAGFASRDPATLSGGEKQRLAMAAILALRPELVLLDEPTTDIDPLGKTAIFALLRAFREAGAGVVVVEHEPGVLEVADRLVLLAHGRVRACGPSAEVARDVELLERCGVRPRDLDVVARALGVDRSLDSVDDAEAELRRSGCALAVAGAAADSLRCGDAHAGPAVLEAEDVRHVYEGGVVALDGVRLRLAAGEFVALVGQNGSGKTTLAKQLVGLLTPTSGTVRLDGADTRRLSLGRIARCVGFVFQDPDHQLFCATVADEVGYGVRHLGLDAAGVEVRVASALEACGLAARRDDDPFLMSKGERQRLAIAAVLALEPRVLILDEPTTGLDWSEQRAMLELLRTQQRLGRSVVVITHAPWLVAQYAERAVLLARGRVVFDGPVPALFAASDLLRGASFALPEATELGIRLRVAVRSAREMAALIRGARSDA